MLYIKYCIWYNKINYRQYIVEANELKKRIMRLMAFALAICMFMATSGKVIAKQLDDIQNEIDDLETEMDTLQNQKNAAQSEKNNAQSQLSGVNSQISSISGAMGDLGEEIEGIDAELVGLLTDIDLIEADIANKIAQIEQTQNEYDAAVEERDRQYESMKIRIKYMYEQGDMTYLNIFLESASMADAVSKADYIESLYTYDRQMLEKYKDQVAYTKLVWDELEEEKSELETSKAELEEEEAYLEEFLAELQIEYDNYDVMLSQAKKQAASYTAKINQQTNEIKRIEKEEQEKQEELDAKKKEAEEAKLKAEQEAAQAALDAGDVDKASELAQNANNTNDDDDDKSSNSSSSSNNGSKPTVSGSGTGSQIASYGLQFVGNPYVAGGTSLTDGADCSGFVMSVYKHFGYNLPRTSYAQSTVGRAVSYSEAQPGDIIYYGGHVGIYIGNGQIVHASTERTGIKVTAATYRSIVTIRRVV